MNHPTLPTRTYLENKLARAVLGAGWAILVVCTAAIACACLLVARLVTLPFRSHENEPCPAGTNEGRSNFPPLRPPPDRRSP